MIHRRALTREIKLTADRSCHVCGLVMLEKTVCMQDLMYSGGGPYLRQRHHECVPVEETESEKEVKG